MVMWKLTGRIRCLAARSTTSTIAPGRSESPLLLSARFSAQSELYDFINFFRLAVADKNGHNPSFFAKAFKPILWHVLRDMPCDCFVTSCPRMTGLVNG